MAFTVHKVGCRHSETRHHLKHLIRRFNVCVGDACLREDLFCLGGGSVVIGCIFADSGGSVVIGCIFADSDDLAVFSGQFLGKLLQLRELILAGIAPGSPDVDHRYLMAGEKRCARHGVPVQISGLKGKLLPGPRRGDRPDRLLYRKLLFERTCILQQR